jgi:biofilm PGA synthesis N-glycosyltransferase PgaC
MKNKIKYSVITPVRDEALYVEKTIESVLSQTILPSQWIIVDDGSSDGTGQILDIRTADIGWIKIIHRENRGARASGSGVMEAFYTGYAELDQDGWDFIVKLDADLSFPPDYFEQCFRFFEIEEKLGIGGGVVCRSEGGQLKIDSAGDPPFHVRGATKIYRRACWEKIKPLIVASGWDTIDEVKANLHGWSTRTFADLKIIQHKPTGGADGFWRDRFKNGRANYVTGYHPVFMLAKCVKRALRKPFFLESIALFAGFCTGYLKGVPQVPDNSVIRYLRQQQIRFLLGKPGLYG